MKPHRICLAIGFFIILLVSGNKELSAQVIKSNVIGATGNLPGATVKGLTFKNSVTTNLQGEFTIVAPDTGMAKLEITYIGYQPMEIELHVKKGINSLSPIELSEGANAHIQEILLSGTMAPSQAKALAIKKQSNAIMDVLAADAIGKLPDRNAAEAVQRMQGVAVARYHGEADRAAVRGTPFSWTSVLFNGSRLPSADVLGNRSTVLDAIPSEIIQYVQVAKAITPEMEGDAIGGSINFITRTAPAKRTLNVSAAGGYNTFSQNGTYNGSLVYGDRFFNKKLGVILSSAIWTRKWGSDSFDVSYNTGLSNEQQKKSIGSVMLKRYLGERETKGVNLGAEYKINAGNKVFVRGMLNKFEDIRPVYEAYVDYNKSRYQYNNRYSHYNTTINGIELGGESQLANHVVLDWTLSDYKSKYYLNTPPANERKGLPIATFQQKIQSGFDNLSNDGLRYWEFDSPNAVGGLPKDFQSGVKDPLENMDPNKLKLNQLVIAKLDNNERDQVGQLNLKWTASSKMKFQIGGKFRHKFRENKFGANHVYLASASLGIPNSAPALSLAELNRQDFPAGVEYFGHLNGNYEAFKLDPLTKNQILDLFDPNFLDQHGFKDYTDAASAASEYSGYENVSAGYIMLDYDISDRLKMLVGVRNEYTHMELNGQRAVPKDKTSELIPAQTKIDYNSLLPMLHFKYKLSENANLRTAYTRTFIRPNFGDMSPGSSIDRTSAIITISQGNPDLKPTFSNNFDLMGEYYFDNIGILTAGIFYKDIQDVIFTDISQQEIEGQLFRISQAKNLNNASTLGLEAGINKRFDFLPGFMSNLGMEVNYSYIDSKTKVPRLGNAGIIDKSPLPNQSKHLMNAILFYENNALMIRLAGNYRAKSLEGIDQTLGPDFYKWSAGTFSLDFSGTVTLTRNLKAFVELNNINNSATTVYLGDSRRTVSQEVYGSRGQAGIRWDILK